VILEELGIFMTEKSH